MRFGRSAPTGSRNSGDRHQRQTLRISRPAARAWSRGRNSGSRERMGQSVNDRLFGYGTSCGLLWRRRSCWLSRRARGNACWRRRVRPAHSSARSGQDEHHPEDEQQGASNDAVPGKSSLAHSGRRVCGTRMAVGGNTTAALNEAAADSISCGPEGLVSEPAVGIEPTTARLRIGCSTTELRWRTVGVRPPNMPWRGLEPRRLAAPPPQDGVSTNFTTRAEQHGNRYPGTGNRS